MKVIGTDNFDRELYDDVLVKDGLTESEAVALADKMNEGRGDYTPTFYKAVPDDYVLYEFKP